MGINSKETSSIVIMILLSSSKSILNLPNFPLNNLIGECNKCLLFIFDTFNPRSSMFIIFLRPVSDSTFSSISFSSNIKYDSKNVFIKNLIIELIGTIFVATFVINFLKKSIFLLLKKVYFIFKYNFIYIYIFL